MITALLASFAKQKFVRELEKNIPEKGSFRPVKCSAAVPLKYRICFELSSVASGEKRAVTVTAERPECIKTECVFTGTNSELLRWLGTNGTKELEEKANKAVYDSAHFYYP